MVECRGSSCINVIPVHIEVAQLRIYAGKALTIFLVVKSLQFEESLIVPSFALHVDGIVELRVERQHVQMHLLTVNDVDSIDHIFDKHSVGCS